jgi:23S rRNA pseudouridine2605 synthase
MTERLQKIISARGVASRRAAEKMIEDGRVSVNGRIARLGDSADPEVDEIIIDGKLLPRQEKQIYLMLHSPGAM